MFVNIVSRTPDPRGVITVTRAKKSAETNLMDIEKMQSAAGRASRLMKVLANPDRLLILCQLSQGERSARELEELLGIVQPKLMQQLTVLRDEDLVSTRREGVSVFYALTSPKALALMTVLYEQFCVDQEE